MLLALFEQRDTLSIWVFCVVFPFLISPSPQIAQQNGLLLPQEAKISSRVVSTTQPFHSSIEIEEDEKKSIPLIIKVDILSL